MTLPLVPASGTSSVTKVRDCQFSQIDTLQIEYSSFREIWRGSKGTHEGRVEIMVYSPWLPGHSPCKDIRSRCNLSCWVAFNDCPGLRIPYGEFFEGIRPYVKVIFPAPIEDNIVIEIGLKDVILVKNIGTEVAESDFSNGLTRLSSINEGQGVLTVGAEEILAQSAGF